MAVPFWHADTSRSPLIVLYLVGADGVQQPDFDSLVRIADGILERRERVVLVHDMTNSRPDAQRRQKVVKWVKANLEQASRYVLGYAVVAPTAFHRGVFTAALWFVKPVTPVEVFGSRADAVQWAITQGQRAGLSGFGKK